MKLLTCLRKKCGKQEEESKKFNSDENDHSEVLTTINELQKEKKLLTEQMAEKHYY
jgi:hypothetical protein